MTDSPQPFFAPVVVAHRDDGWTPARQAAFIEALADTACVSDAAASVGMSASSAYRLRRRTDARAFDAAWRAALAKGIDRLGSMAVERAIHGKMKRVFYHGELIDEERVYSDRLLLWLLENGGRALDRREAADGDDDWDSVIARLSGKTHHFRVWDRGCRLATNFPPPPLFDGYEEGRPGDPDYERSLTDWEQQSYRARFPAEDVGDKEREAFFGDEPDEFWEARTDPIDENDTDGEDWRAAAAARHDAPGDFSFNAGTS